MILDNLKTNPTNTLLVKYTDDKLAPHRAHPTDAGADLKSNIAVDIYPNEQKTIGTGIAVKIPEGFVGLVFSRSSMGKSAVTLANSVGVIDSDYRGEVKVMIKNHGSNIYKIDKYDRIAQLVIIPIALPDLKNFEGTNEEWNDTSRGINGFGSTGVQ